MANNTNKRVVSRLTRQKRVRRRVRGTDERPRLCVYRSLKYTYAQLISDESNKVIGALSTRNGSAKSSGSVESAKELGMKVAELAKQHKIEQVVFDRNGYVYHGRVAAVADGAREGGLQV